MEKYFRSLVLKLSWLIMTSNVPSTPATPIHADFSLWHINPDNRLKTLQKHANDFTIDQHQPIRWYYNYGTQMIRMADTYYEEGSTENAYILYFKYVTLFIEKIPKHPEYHSAENAKEKMRSDRALKAALSKCEEIQEILNKKYKNEHQIYLEKIEEKEVN